MTSLAILVLAPTAHAADAPDVAELIDGRFEDNSQIAMQIWDYAELGYLERNSSALLQAVLAEHGFEIESDVAGIPTAFVASFGNQGPVVALLAEFDALPGITQTASPFREEIPGKAGSHACGHHLLGTGSVAAAIAISQWLADTGTPGTVRLFGTPAEEGGSGKVYMVRDGLFDDVDVVLTWHPDDVNRSEVTASLANRSAKFRFHGVSAHAAVAPEKARSALDGVEAFNFMINLMREHLPQETRIHYVITSGGSAPNVVPDFAEVFYYVRHPSATTLLEIWDRVENAARGAAEGTGTEVDWEIIHGNHPLLPNQVIADLLQRNLERVGGVDYDEQDQAFAEAIYATLDQPEFRLGDQARVMPIKQGLSMGSTDVGDVSWNVPTAEMRIITWVPGTPSHSWQAVAAGGTAIGLKGMQLAAKVLALSAEELFLNPELIRDARQELRESQGDDFEYKPLLGDRAPALDYRLNP